MEKHVCTKGHHTLKLTSESVSQRLVTGPVFSIYKRDKKDKIQPFVGEGYYFWDDNIEAARWWGDKHYKGRYRVFTIEFRLNYDSGVFLDLVGNRAHLILIGSMINKLKMRLDCEGWKLNQFLDYFRKNDEQKPGVFPYRVVRFNDNSAKVYDMGFLALSQYHHRIALNPFYAVCVYNRADLDMSSFKFLE